MLKIAHLGAASALAILAAVGLSRAGTPPPDGPPAAQAVPAPAAEQAGQTPPRVFRPYVVQPPDLILVEVLQALEGRPISGERLVRADGKITLGFYGDVEVAGLTIPEIKEKITIHLKKYLNDELLGLVGHDPETGKPVPIDPKDADRVFVDVVGYNSEFYYLVGAFAAPGRFQVTGSDTVLDALVLAGGLADDADARKVLLVRERPEAGEPKSQPIDVRAILEGAEGAVNHRLRPGDRLIAARTKAHAADAPEATSSREMELRLKRLESQVEELSRKLDERR